MKKIAIDNNYDRNFLYKNKTHLLKIYNKRIEVLTEEIFLSEAGNERDIKIGVICEFKKWISEIESIKQAEEIDIAGDNYI